LLIGGASLKLQDFQNIIALASEILEAQLWVWR
jgi:triosephosphate isomerase